MAAGASFIDAMTSIFGAFFRSGQQVNNPAHGARVHAGYFLLRSASPGFHPSLELVAERLHLPLAFTGRGMRQTTLLFRAALEQRICLVLPARASCR